MHADEKPSPLRTWLSTLPALFVLLVSVAQGSSEIVQARMLALGEEWWPGYADLRNDPVTPECDPEKIGADSKPADADDAMLDGLVGDAPPADGATAPAPEAAPAAEAPAAEAPPAPPAEAPAAAEGEDAMLDGLVGGGAAAPNAEAVAAAKQKCVDEHAHYTELQARITPTLRQYRAVDHALTATTEFGRDFAIPSLVFLIVLCAATASALGAHISLRSPRNVAEHRVSEAYQIVANVLAALSFKYRYDILSTSGLEDASPGLAAVWGLGFVAMALIHASRLARPPTDLAPGGSYASGLPTVPLYAHMTVVAAAWFFGVEGHHSGLAIFVDKLTSQAGLYLQVGLYVWAGMLLKRTALPHRAFDVLRPWKLPPELLAAVVIIASAVPTAYSGASGIFVIAAGAVIYDELRRAGARNELAIAATAMAGSLGVVLSPCLLVVIVASLNKQVTTTELFAEGYKAFALTAVLTVAVLLWRRKGPLTVAPLGEAIPGSLRALGALVPYAVVLLVTIAVFGFGLHAWMDEHSAANIVLVVLLLYVLLEGRARSLDGTSPLARLAGSTTETTVHIGALLALMAFSVAFGGIIERAEIMSMVPAELGGPWPTMAILVLLLIVIGMLMDPYGAVILVSATIANVAYENGIEPLHFWMTVLCAFELGYLTPPVALNHLLTRLVIGADNADEQDFPADATFWDRQERYLLPVAVMGTALLLVAFVPLAVAGH